MTNDNKFKILQNELAEKSFKIKPILLELVNYSHFHSVSNQDEEDINNRFLGRKNIINRLRSFIHETNKNTGAYLVSGFRGMGKTSVVNKALATLNPKSKFNKFFIFWLFLLPLVFFKSKIIYVFKELNYQIYGVSLKWFIISLFILCTIYYLGHRDIRKDHSKQSLNLYAKLNKKNNFLFYADLLIGFIYTIIYTLYIGLRAIFNPKLQKHKYAFHKILRYLIIYLVTSIFLVLVFQSNINNTEDKSFLWFMTGLIISAYFFVDLYVEIVKWTKKNNYIIIAS